MLSAAEVSALWVSLKVAFTALVLMVIPGVPLAWLLARRSFPGHAFVDAFTSLPLVLPPVVTGYVLLWLLAPSGWLGERMGLDLLFTWFAAALAAAVVAFPLFVRSLRSGIEGVDPRLEQAAANLGASPLRVAVRVTLPLARSGLWTGLVLGFSRALGEFGATILVAGNIPGRTQTIPLAIFTTAQTSDLGEILPLVTVISIISFAAVFVAGWLGRPRSAKSSWA